MSLDTFTKQTRIYTSVVIFMTSVFFALLLLPTALFAESSSASVSNSVNVSSGGSTSYSSVKTIINGEVVEDIESHESGSVESRVSVSSNNGETTHSSSVIFSTSTTDTQTASSSDYEIYLQIKALMELIQHYVSLLNALS